MSAQKNPALQWHCTGREIFPAMLAAIEAAQKSIHLETYTYSDGKLGRQFLEVLLAAARRGVRVRVLEGPFAGKVGVVQELDGKGSARVMLGLLATRLDVKDLVASAEGRERPALSSSHRKPIPSAR